MADQNNRQNPNQNLNPPAAGEIVPLFHYRKADAQELCVSLLDKGEYVYYQPPLLDTAIEYPSEWFMNNSGSKPSITIKLSNNSTLETARGWAYSVISGTHSSVSLVLEYLYHVFKTMEVDLPVDWTSYRVVISKGKINPLSLVNVEIINSGTSPSIPNPVSLPSSDDIGLVIYITSLFRIARTHERHQDTLGERISPLITSIVSPQFIARITTSRSCGSALAALPEVEFLLSALDMFLDRFQRHPFSKARVGTIILRNMGFSAFGDINYFTNMVGAERESEAIPWLMTPDCGKEVRRLTVTTEEFGMPFSYLPYSMGLQLSHKSPFSASANPNVHVIIHTVGSLYGIDRSINAIMVKDAKVAQDAVNAAMVFLRSRNTSLLIPQLMPRYMREKYDDDLRERINAEKGKRQVPAIRGAEAEGRDEEQEPEDDDALDLDDFLKTQSSDPYQVAIEYADHEYTFTEWELEALRNAVSKIEDPRDGTIGKWTKTNFLSFLSPRRDT